MRARWGGDENLPDQDPARATDKIGTVPIHPAIRMGGAAAQCRAPIDGGAARNIFA